MTQLQPNGQEPAQELLPPWANVAAGHVAHPDRPEVKLAVALLVGTPNGQLAGALAPAFAKQLGEELVRLAGECSTLQVASELPPEMRPQ